MNLNTSITKRRLKRAQKDGSEIVHERYVLNFKNPKTGKRVQLFFKRKLDAQNKQRQLLSEFERGAFSLSKDKLKVKDVFDYWIEDRKGQVKPNTLKGYKSFGNYIVGPILVGSKAERFQLSMCGKNPKGSSKTPMLGELLVDELTTADIRAWHRKVQELVGEYTANKAKQYLDTMLSLAAEDYNFRPPAMPRRTGKGRRKEKKKILQPEEFKVLLEEARKDLKYGLYYAFPFLVGTRPCEQLALHWEDLDFNENTIRIHRVLERDGTITNHTKTEAGMREVPMNSLLRQWLLEWKLRCPKYHGELNLVFPSHGARQKWPVKKHGGGVLLYSNFRIRVWVKAFEQLAELGLPYVTPHSARHYFVSTLQARGVEVGLVAKLAGHATVSVTLDHYTQAVGNGEHAVEKLIG